MGRYHSGMQDLVSVLVAARQELGLSQGQVARAVGVHASEVSRIEKGERCPSWDVIRRLLPGYGLTPSEFGRRIEGLPSAWPPDPLAAAMALLVRGPWKREVANAVLVLLSETSQGGRAAPLDLLAADDETAIGFTDPAADPEAEAAALEQARAARRRHP